MLGLSKLATYTVAAVLLIGAVLAGVYVIYSDGGKAQAGADASATLKDVNHGIVIRDEADKAAVGRTDTDAFERMRPADDK